MKQRIQKLLGAAGVGSRRQIEAMVLQGRISVNGRTESKLPVLIDPAVDRVDVDGERIRLAQSQSQRFYFLMNKPKDVYCTNVAQGAQRRAVDLLPPELAQQKARLYPVGRLDADARGLLLLTNDGELTNQLTHPRYGVIKTYRASVDGEVSEEVLDQVRKGGTWLHGSRKGRDFKTNPTTIAVLARTPEKTVLEITLREGPNRHVRRVLAKLGHKVREITRTRFGPLNLDRMKPGEVRPLSEKELRLLKKSAKGSTHS